MAIKQNSSSNESEVEKYSGLRIRKQLLTPSELKDRFSDIRFVRLPSINKADKVTTNTHSQGIRFLSKVTGTTDPNDVIKQTAMQKKQTSSSEKRKLSTTNMGSSAVIKNQQLDAKRTKTSEENSLADKAKQGTEKMIELDYYISSDEEL